MFMLLLLLGGSLIAPAASASAPAGPQVATYNVFMLPRTLSPNWGQDQRADLIASEGVLRGQDVVVLQEAFDNAASAKLLGHLAGEYPHQTPVVGRSREGWDATRGAYSDTRPEDGGAVVLSRWPITEKTQYIYAESCGADAQSNKGFAYTTIQAPDGPLHVIGTHTQADDNGCHGSQAQVRARQLASIANFVRDKKIPANERVLVAGDFNIDATAGEFGSALTTLGARAPEMPGHPYSYDPSTNSVAKNQAPDGPDQRLDYVLPLNGYGPDQQWINQVDVVHSPPWTVTSWGTTYTYTDFSDHYPVRATPK